MPTFSNDRTLDAVTRERRTFLESPRFKPDWRERQVNAYINEVRRLGLVESGRVPATPTWEDDQHVSDYYMFRMRRSSVIPGVVDAIRWAEECHEYNTEHGFSSRIKALVLAKQGDADIAEEICVPQAYVEYYVRLFFDVRHSLHNPHFTANLVRPFSCTKETGLEATQPEEKMEKIFLMLGLHAGLPHLQAFMRFDVALQSSLAEEFERMFFSNLVTAGYGATIVEKVNYAPRSEDVKRMLSMTRARAEASKGGNAQGSGGPSNLTAEGLWLQSAVEAFQGKPKVENYEDNIGGLDDLESDTPAQGYGGTLPGPAQLPQGHVAQPAPGRVPAVKVG